MVDEREHVVTKRLGTRGRIVLNDYMRRRLKIKDGASLDFYVERSGEEVRVIVVPSDSITP